MAGATRGPGRPLFRARGGVLLVLAAVAAAAGRAGAWTAAGDVGDTVVRAVMTLEKLDFAFNARQDPRMTRATLEIEIHPAWAPVMADRFIELCSSEFYDVRPPPPHLAWSPTRSGGTRGPVPGGRDRTVSHLTGSRAPREQGNRFFRVSPGYVAQFGIHDNPKWTNYWLKRRMPDELMLDDPGFVPHEENNKNFTMGFARENDSNSGMQVFINLRDNSEIFAGKDILTFARIVNDEREKLAGLFPAEPGIDMGKYDHVQIDLALQEGGAYLDNFGKLSVVKSCKILGGGGGERADELGEDEEDFENEEL